MLNSIILVYYMQNAITNNQCMIHIEIRKESGTKQTFQIKPSFLIVGVWIIGTQLYQVFLTKGKVHEGLFFGPVKSQNKTRRKNATSYNILMTHNSSKFALEKISLSLFMNFQCPKEWQKDLKTRKIVILAPFSMINSKIEIWSPKHDTKPHGKTIWRHLSIHWRLWESVVYGTS